MKISKINFYLNQNKNQIKENKNVKISQRNFNEFSKTMPTKNFLAFCGGYSLDLLEAYKHLKEEEYPNDIQKMVYEVLSIKNPANLTLHDVHFQKYSGILDCFTLEELKEKYPEFKNVICAYDIETKNEIIKDFQEEKSEIFTSEEDLTLQLIKLYWGKGFSLSDLEKYTQENSKENQVINLYHVMKKLNIPLMNRRYAQVLKLSDKEYNQKYTQEMSIKIKEAKEAKIQKAQGEPIVIPRGELSQAHKEHISKSLKEYYKNNPHAIVQMSKRQKEYYEENPEQKERMQKVMLFAWNKTQEGKSLIVYLNKFFKKIGIEQIEDFSMIGQTYSKTQQQALAQFWQKNPWACEKMSIAVQKGWEFVKNDEEMRIMFDDTPIPGVRLAFNTLPTGMSKKIIQWAKEKGYQISPYIKLGRSILYDRETQIPRKAKEQLEIVNTVIDKYYETHKAESDLCTTALHMSVVDLINDLETNSINLPKTLKDPIKREILKFRISMYGDERGEIYWTNQQGMKVPTKDTDNIDIVSLLTVIMDEALSINCLDVAEYIDKKHDFYYQTLSERYGF